MAISQQSMDRYSLRFLAVVGVLIVIGGVWQIRSTVFAYKTDVFIPAQAAIERKFAEARANAAGSISETTEAERLTALKDKDTDKDGLSDFDEEYVYGTSIYLADSDSDGKKDKEEIDGGTNPNCVEGEECRQTSESTVNPQTLISAAAITAFASLDPTGAATAEETAQLKSLAENPTQLREFLKQKGVSQETLDKTDDATLLKIAEDAVSASSGTSKAATDPVAAMTQQANLIKAYTIDQKRQMLIQSGAAEADVKKLSDAEINSIIGTSVDRALTSYTDPAAVLGTGSANSNSTNSATNN